MLKKIMAASAMLAFFACSSESEDKNTTNSSSSKGSVSSSSQEIETVLISNFNTSGGLSPLFNTSPYGYTLKANKDEDLTQFWSCPPEQQDNKPDIVACEREHQLDKTNNAILQNYLTTQYAPLHYIINNMATANPSQRSIKLDRYNLTGAGDQAALGLNVSDDNKSIEEKGIAALNGTAAFTYFYAGGAHKFRIAVSDADYWEADIPAQAEEDLVTIYTKDLKGMGSFAADETPFDIAKATKFLWVVEFDAKTSANNTGSLLIYNFHALVEK